VDVGLREGITAVIQPGGSGNDYQCIEVCNEADATMVYTDQRSFMH
jgi:phosphoribosylaminoimidazolecarboxamide formyltransferase/IMP cyclohydrolase